MVFILWLPSAVWFCKPFAESWSCEMSGSSEKAMPVDLRCRQDRILVLLNVLLKRTLQDLGFFSFINLSRPQQLTAGNRDQALSLWSGCTDSKTLDYQRTNPRKYQMVRTHTKETTWIQDPASPNHQTGSPHHSALPIRGKINKQKTQHKSHSIWSLHKPVDQP